MKIKVLLIVFLIITPQVRGQKEINITGTVIDKETKESLPFATIVYQTKSIGTISDINGHFNLTLTDANPSDSIFVSFIGYETIKTIISKSKQINKFELKPHIDALKEVVITSKKFDLNQFIQEVITDYNKNKKEDPHIATAHYREKAMENNKYIMFMESMGYSVFGGKKANAAPLSNFSFFCENTRCYVENPKWIKYKENRAGHDNQNVLPGGGANLNVFRYFEVRGLLSKKNYKEFNYKIDSTYFIGDNLIRSIGFESNNSKGSMHVFANTKQILKIECSTDKYWSTAFHKRIDAQVEIQFNYFGKAPFISSIIANYEHKGLQYFNSLTVLIQKFNDFNLNKDEYWSMNSFNVNPYIEYVPKQWETKGIAIDKDYDRIAADLNLNLTLLDKGFKDFSGRWFFTNIKGNELAVTKIKQLKQNF